MSRRTITLAFSLFPLLLAVTPPVHAELYACKKDGRLYYASVPNGEQCKPVKSYEEPPPAKATEAAPPPPPPPKRLQSAKPSTSTAKATPARSQRHVPAQTQKRRDSKRSEVLRYELVAEVSMLNLLQEEMKDAKDADIAAYLREQTQIHLLNINAIKRELERLGINADLYVDYSSD